MQWIFDAEKGRYVLDTEENDSETKGNTSETREDVPKAREDTHETRENDPEPMKRNFVEELAVLAPEHKKLAEALVKKMKSYDHWPDSKKLGMKLLPFIESKEMVFLMKDISKADFVGYHELYECFGYTTFIHIFILYILKQKEGYEEIISALNFLVDRAVQTVVQGINNREWYLLRWIFILYNAEKEPLLHMPVKKLNELPNDALVFYPINDGTAHAPDRNKVWMQRASYPINDGTAYAVSAYSEHTCGHVKIPQTYKGKPVKMIYGFYYCYKLTGIDIPEGIEEIGESCFSECDKLQKIRLPESLKRIGSRAFSNCGFKSITIPKNVSEIFDFAFPWTKLSDIKVIGHTERPEGWDVTWNNKNTLDHCRGDFHNVIWDYKEDAPETEENTSETRENDPELVEFDAEFEQEILEITALTASAKFSRCRYGDDRYFESTIDLTALRLPGTEKIYKPKEAFLVIKGENDYLTEMESKIAPDSICLLKVRKRDRYSRETGKFMGEKFTPIEVVESNVTGDKELEKIAEKQRQPVIYHDPTLGDFELERKYREEYEGKVKWNNEDVQFHITSYKGKRLDRVFAIANEFVKDQVEWDKKIREFACRKFLKVKNKDWLEDDDDEKLTPEEFISRIKVEDIYIKLTNNFQVTFGDDDIFFGHAIDVYGNLEKGPMKAELWG